MSLDLIKTEPVHEPIHTVELDWYSSDQNDTIVVTPRDRQRFEIQTDRAIRILQVAHEETLFHKQFHLLLNHLAGWIRDHRAAIRNAYLTLHDGAFAFIVVRTSPRHDADFEDSLSDLDLDIAGDPALNLVTLNAIALPPVSEAGLSSFVDPRFVLSYHGR